MRSRVREVLIQSPLIIKVYSVTGDTGRVSVQSVQWLRPGPSLRLHQAGERPGGECGWSGKDWSLITTVSFRVKSD
jgi:hypothetical protein